MVMKKRLDNGFSGFSDWTVPRGPRSLRKRVHRKKDFEDGQICAIELLASLAGKLLQDGESTACSNTSDGDHSVIGTNVVKEERSNEEKGFKVECCDGGSSQSCDLALEKTDQKQNLKKLQYVDNNTVLDCTSVVVNSNSSDEACDDVKPVILRKTEFEDYRAEPEEEGSPDYLESTDIGMKIVNVEEHESKGFGIGFPNMADSHNSKDLKKSYAKSPTMANSSFKTKLPLSTDAIRSSFSRYRNYFKLASRDDDEKFRSNKSSIHSNSFRSPSRIAGRRIRKLLNSKHWKAAPKLKDCEVPRSDEETRNPFRKRKLYFNGDSLYKKRRFFDRSSRVNSDGGMSSESVTNSPEKSVHIDKSGLAAVLHGASVETSSGQQASFHSKDAHVKFSIRSFKVPELFIDVPEDATVGSLKNIVLEAVTTILKGGLHVGVLVHGKKVRDDNRTLLQTGLSCKDNLDTVGFTLEPNLVHNTLCSEDPPQMLECDMTELLPSSPVNPVSSSGLLDVALPHTTLTNSQNQDENKHELITTSIDQLPDNSLQDCKALVPVPEMTMEALAVVPLNPKSKRSEVVQRRTRRPFSVTEVEALVQAVEELGTGRWRDVKFRAFENADHRTYVDLKDKWKTLVHTAKISPQQRRGEPVPQELLDRVLAAHAYWSQHQAKQHGGKHHQAGVVKAIEGSSS